MISNSNVGDVFIEKINNKMIIVIVVENYLGELENPGSNHP